MPVTLDDVDQWGRPVMYTPCGRIDLPVLAKQGVTLELLLRRYVVQAEKLRLAVGRSADPLAGHLQVQRRPATSVPHHTAVPEVHLSYK